MIIGDSAVRQEEWHTHILARTHTHTRSIHTYTHAHTHTRTYTPITHDMRYDVTRKCAAYKHTRTHAHICTYTYTHTPR